MKILLNEDLLLKESGVRNINKLRSLFDKVVIVTHQDLDGVISAIGMKNYFERYGFNVIDTQIIQYGSREWTLKKSNTDGDVMFCLCDFSHGKPMFTVHLDHHDKQVGTEKGTSTSFRQARSNAETISQVVSPSDIFTHDDIKMVSTVDSADFVRMGVTPDDIMRFIFTYEKPIIESKTFIEKFVLWFKTKLGKTPKKELTVSDGKKMIALVTNKLLLSYKNKPKFLERLVMESTPSLINIYLNILRIVKEEGYASPEMMKANQDEYIEKQKQSDKVKYDKKTGIITQYGGGSLFKPGAYDRYVPFKNYPDADFLIIVWPLGLIQVSMNPFKKGRSLKGVNLGEVMSTVLDKFKSELENYIITLDTIKYFSEKDKSFSVDESIGFTYNDMVALFNDTEGGIIGLNKTPDGSSPEYTVDRWQSAIKRIMDKPYVNLSDKERNALKLLKISGWDLVKSQSGGHKAISNASGFMYFGKDGTDWIKRIARELYSELKNRILTSKGVLGENTSNKREKIFLNGFEMWLDREKSMLYDKKHSQHGVGFDVMGNDDGIYIHSQHLTKDEKRQLIDYLKYRS